METYFKNSQKQRKALLNILEDMKEARDDAIFERDKTLMVINNLTDGLIMVRNDKKIDLFNPQAEKFFGLKKEDVVNKLIDNKSSDPRFRELNKAILAGSSSKEDEVKTQIEIKYPSRRILEVSSISLIGVRNQALGILKIFHDITREIEIDKIKSEFISIAAHQLRTPLSSIKWSWEILSGKDKNKISDEGKKILEKAKESTDMAISLLNDLLDVAEIEETRYVFKAKELDLKKLIKNLYKNYLLKSKEKNIDLQIKFSEELIPFVLADEKTISIVIRNFLNNALDYTMPKGKIIISVVYKKESGKVEVSVKDTGIGISVEGKNRVFSKFFRDKEAMRMKTNGTGIGLFVSKKIIEAHGGKIWFVSEQGKGSTFVFDLPVGGKESIGA